MIILRHYRESSDKVAVNGPFEAGSYQVVGEYYIHKNNGWCGCGRKGEAAFSPIRLI
jgi:hypothetical protein